MEKHPQEQRVKNLEPEEPQALLICGLLSPENDLIRSIETTLEEEFGSVLLRSELVPFTWTDYYNAELGEGILRRWVIFSPLVNLVEPWRFKHASCKVEDSLSKNGKRRINVDPGFIRLDGLWLLTTKPAGHRAYLGESVWIELTLRFLHDRCEEMPWTYPDHRDAAAQAFFLKAREFLKKELHNV